MHTGDGSNGARGHPVVPSVHSLGSRQERQGPGEQPATSRVLCASSRRHPGDASGEAKRSGAGVRGKRRTTARGHRGESEGAEESARGKAPYTRRRTDGAGPSPLRRGKHRSPVHAPAVHGWTSVELEQWAPTLHGQPQHACPCFGLLYELIEQMERGEEIVFAEEVGSWRIPGDEKVYLRAYIRALADTATPEAFTEAAIALLRRESYASFIHTVY